MTKKQLRKDYDTVLADRREMLSFFEEIRSIINPQCKHDGVAPWSVVQAVKRLYTIGSLIPFTQEQLDQWNNDLEKEILEKMKNRA